MTDLILASQSGSRRAMLDAAGVRYRAIPAHLDELAITGALRRQMATPLEIAEALAIAKAQAISTIEPDALVIGSDSTVSVDGQLFDKPASREDAARHLAHFSGRTLWLSSAVALARGGQMVWRHSENARLEVQHLSEGFIYAYLDAEWPAIAACVGCFRMEGRGVTLFARIDGDHFTILGMPLVPLLGALRRFGAMPS